MAEDKRIHHLGAQQELALPETLGYRLRRAREALGISIEDVADHLCLNASVICDMEADQYTGQKNTVFMRGYIRTYARLVHVPLEDVSKVFTELQLVEPTVEQKSMQCKISPEPIAYKSKKMRIISYSIAGLLLVLVLVWWHLDRL